MEPLFSRSLCWPPQPLRNLTLLLGVVILGIRANVGLAAAATGASVYNGDTLSTDASGTLRVRFGGAQIMLGPGTTVDLHEQDGMVDVILRQGNVRFAGVPGSPIRSACVAGDGPNAPE